MYRRICLGLAAGSAGLLLWVGVTAKHAGRPPQRRRAVEEAESLAERPVYRYSVVRGGVYSAQEVARERRRDPVVGAHYAGIGPGLRAVRVESDFSAHVSYRVRNAVYWTRKRVRLRAGETVLTDGEQLIRARCGNRISMEPQEPTREQEPAEGVLEQALPPPAAGREGDAGREDMTARGGYPAIPGLIPGLPTPVAVKPPFAPDLPLNILPSYLLPPEGGGAPRGGGGNPAPVAPPEPAPPAPENGPPYFPVPPDHPLVPPQPETPPAIPASPAPGPVPPGDTPVAPFNPAPWPSPKPVPVPAADQPDKPPPEPAPPGPGPSPSPLPPGSPQPPLTPLTPPSPDQPFTPTPEPGGLALLGGAALIVLRWRALCGK